MNERLHFTGVKRCIHRVGIALTLIPEQPRHGSSIFTNPAQHGAIEASPSAPIQFRAPLVHGRSSMRTGDKSLGDSGESEHFLAESRAGTGSETGITPTPGASIDDLMHWIHRLPEIVKRVFGHLPAVIHKKGANGWMRHEILGEKSATLHVRLPSQNPDITDP